MKLVKAIVRPNKVDDVKNALEKIQISGMTVTEVRGPYGDLPRAGVQREPPAKDGDRSGSARFNRERCGQGDHRRGAYG